jgi:hypothetical protein
MNSAKSQLNHTEATASIIKKNKALAFNLNPGLFLYPALIII